MGEVGIEIREVERESGRGRRELERVKRGVWETVGIEIREVEREWER